MKELQLAVPVGLGLFVGVRVGVGVNVDEGGVVGVRVAVGFGWHLLNVQFLLKHWLFEVQEQLFALSDCHKQLLSVIPPSPPV